MTPGDGFSMLSPIVVRGEELKRLAQADGIITDAEQAELDSYRLLAVALLKHTTQYPLANTSQEESAQDLRDEEARSAREREAALHDGWQALRPLLWEIFKGLGPEVAADVVRRLKKQ